MVLRMRLYGLSRPSCTPCCKLSKARRGTVPYTASILCPLCLGPLLVEVMQDSTSMLCFLHYQAGMAL